MQKRILINMLPYTNRLKGTGYYIKRILFFLQKLDKENEYTLIFSNNVTDPKKLFCIYQKNFKIKKINSIKVIILYIFIFIFYFYDKKLSLVLFTLPVLLLSSRFLYFASGLMPILLSFIFYSNRNLVNIKIRYLLFVTRAIFYSLAIYNYKSITMQLGV